MSMVFYGYITQRDLLYNTTCKDAVRLVVGMVMSAPAVATMTKICEIGFGSTDRWSFYSFSATCVNESRNWRLYEVFFVCNMQLALLSKYLLSFWQRCSL